MRGKAMLVTVVAMNLALPGAEARLAGHVNSLKAKGTVNLMDSTPSSGSSVSLGAQPNATDVSGVNNVTASLLGSPKAAGEGFFAPLKKGGGGPIGPDTAPMQSQPVNVEQGGDAMDETTSAVVNATKGIMKGSTTSASSLGMFRDTGGRWITTAMQYNNVGVALNVNRNGRQLSLQEIMNLPAGERVSIMTPDGRLIAGTWGSSQGAAALASNSNNSKYPDISYYQQKGGASARGLGEFQPDADTDLRTLGVTKASQLDYYSGDSDMLAKIRSQGLQATAKKYLVEYTKTGVTLVGGGGGGGGGE